MRHHLDEFTVTDFRHTLEVVWRVVRHRRWFFIFPFCIVSCLALVCSLYVPRWYTGSTVVKREQDPVFANMMGASWTHPYANIRDQMPAELKDIEGIEEVLNDLGLPEGSGRSASGELNPVDRAARRVLAQEIARGLSVQGLTSSAYCDVDAIKLKLRDAKHLPDILRGIRDRYVRVAKVKTVELLRDVEQFFRTESEKCRSELSGYNQRLVEYELKYTGIDPDAADPTRAEQMTLVVERVDLERRLDSLNAKRNQIERRLADLVNAASAAAAGEAAGENVAYAPNLRYSELLREIRILQRQIAENKTLRGMTEEHPVIRQLQMSLALRRQELAEVPAKLTVAQTLDHVDDVVAGETLGRRLKRQVADNEAKAVGVASRLAAVRDQIATLNRGRAITAGARQDYVELKQEAAVVRAELDSWQQNLGPIEHIFMLEDRERTIHFSTAQEVATVTRPSSPDAKLVMLICFAIGAAVGVLFVLFTELMDQSYRTVKQLKSSLGIPVIESVDEIVTEALRRQRVIRYCVLRPAAALVCVSVMVIAGLMAYLSIEDPGGYETLRSAPLQAYHSVMGRS